jgi:hypothetical protein
MSRLAEFVCQLVVRLCERLFELEYGLIFELVVHLDEDLSQLDHPSTEMMAPVLILRLVEVSELMNRLAEFVCQLGDRLSDQMFQLKNGLMSQMMNLLTDTALQLRNRLTERVL